MGRSEDFSRQLIEVAGVAAKARGLDLLVLHGSRTKGQARPESDWDFAYAGGADFDPDQLLADLSEIVGDRIDLADLSRASGLLRFRAAAEGTAIHERQPGMFARFRLAAVEAWCEMEPVLTRAYGATLDRMKATSTETQ